MRANGQLLNLQAWEQLRLARQRAPDITHVSLHECLQRSEHSERFERCLCFISDWKKLGAGEFSHSRTLTE